MYIIYGEGKETHAVWSEYNDVLSSDCSLFSHAFNYKLGHVQNVILCSLCHHLLTNELVIDGFNESREIDVIGSII